MRLFQKTANVFFGLIGVIGLFMPLFGYSYALVSGNYNIYDIIKTIASSDGSFSAGELLNTLGEYGFRIKAIVMSAAFAAGVLLLLVLIALSFTNTPYTVQAVVGVIGFAGFICAMAIFNNFAHAVTDGAVPISAFSGLISGTADNSDLGDMVSGLLSGLFTDSSSNVKLTLGWGAYTSTVMIGIMFIINTFYAVFKRKIYELDGISEEDLRHQKAERKEKRAAKKAAKSGKSVEQTETKEIEENSNNEPAQASEDSCVSQSKYSGVNPNTSKRKLKKQKKTAKK